MNPELELLVQEKIDAAKAANNGVLSEQAKTDIMAFVKQYKDDEQVKKDQDSQPSPSGESTTQGQSDALQSTTEVSTDESLLEQEDDDQVDTDISSEEEVIIEEQRQEDMHLKVENACSSFELC